MKRNKLLIPLLTSLSIVPAVTISSCGDGKSEADKIAEAIFNPINVQTKQITNFSEEFNKLTTDERKAELIYDLFGVFNLENNFKLNSGDSFAKLYKENKVGIQTNITKCGIDSKEGKLLCYFLGYISFVFIQDYNDTYKTNDYVMITYDIQGQEVILHEQSCSLEYKITDTTFENPCVGFTKIKYQKASKEVMQYIEEVNTNNYKVKNSHNWTK